jgi:hypothetical protein
MGRAHLSAGPNSLTGAHLNAMKRSLPSRQFLSQKKRLDNYADTGRLVPVTGGGGWGRRPVEGRWPAIGGGGGDVAEQGGVFRTVDLLERLATVSIVLTTDGGDRRGRMR